MNLVGNLEDLGLGDILQIVSLSRKSGVLSLKHKQSEGKIYFSSGQVIRAWSNQDEENIGELLIRKGLVTSSLLERALAVQRKSGVKQRIGTILSDRFEVPRERIEETVRDQIERIVHVFFSWEKGSFDFELGEPEEIAATNFNPLQFMLEQGLNPQWLALESSHLRDKNRGYSSTDAATGLTDDVFFSRKSARSSATLDRICAETQVVLVDDDQATRETLASLLLDKGIISVTFSNGRALLDAMADWSPKGRSPLFVIDLIMATLDGEGIFGGLELAGIIRKEWPRQRIVLMTDHADVSARHRGLSLGIDQVLDKPAKKSFAAGNQSLAVRDFIDKLKTIIKSPAGEGTAGFFNIGRDLSHEAGVDLLTPGAFDNSPDLGARVKALAQDISTSRAPGGIVLPALQMAGEIFSRAVIFRYKSQRLFGVGQFGLDVSCGDADALIRDTVIALEEDSFFADSLAQPVPRIVSPGPTASEQTFFDRLQGGVPDEMFIGPIKCFGEVVYLLYGDNCPENKPIVGVEPLEIFLLLAGLALEKEELQKELHKCRAV